MRLGLGTGSTARHFVDLLGEKVAAGSRVRCVATSEATLAQATGLGIPMTTLDDMPELDLTVDGADEIDPELKLIKGGGGALLREKIVAAASQKHGGDRRRIQARAAARRLSAAGRGGPFRPGFDPSPHPDGDRGSRSVGRPRSARRRLAFVTDGGHFILDCRLGAIPEPERLAAALSAIPGVVEHGLFIGYARAAFIAGADGVRTVGRI